MTDHPITPPPELVQRWVAEIYSDPTIHVHPIPIHPIIRLVELASQHGADQELEACCEWLDYNCPSVGAHHLRADRRQVAA